MTSRPGRAARAIAVLDTRIAGDPHQPAQPAWDCRSCSQPWPCAPAKVRLTEAYGLDRVGLAVYMAALYDQALTELPLLPASDVYSRFVSWARVPSQPNRRRTAC